MAKLIDFECQCCILKTEVLLFQWEMVATNSEKPRSLGIFTSSWHFMPQHTRHFPVTSAPDQLGSSSSPTKCPPPKPAESQVTSSDDFTPKATWDLNGYDIFPKVDVHEKSLFNPGDAT